jgi:hypothetical protein
MDNSPNKAHHNIVLIIKKYWKLQTKPLDKKKLDTLRTKLKTWTTQTNTLSKKIQKTQYWCAGTLTQMLLGGGYFIYFGENVKVVHLWKEE